MSFDMTLNSKHRTEKVTKNLRNRNMENQNIER